MPPKLQTVNTQPRKDSWGYWSDRIISKKPGKLKNKGNRLLKWIRERLIPHLVEWVTYRLTKKTKSKKPLQSPHLKNIVNLFRDNLEAIRQQDPDRNALSQQMIWARAMYTVRTVIDNSSSFQRVVDEDEVDWKFEHSFLSFLGFHMNVRHCFQFETGRPGDLVESLLEWQKEHKWDASYNAHRDLRIPQPVTDEENVVQDEDDDYFQDDDNDEDDDKDDDDYEDGDDEDEDEDGDDEEDVSQQLIKQEPAPRTVITIEDDVEPQRLIKQEPAVADSVIIIDDDDDDDIAPAPLKSEAPILHEVIDQTKPTPTREEKDARGANEKKRKRQELEDARTENRLQSQDLEIRGEKLELKEQKLDWKREKLDKERRDFELEKQIRELED